ncbi:alpha/beta hydrolase [Halioxenophilus sp. WMMB6]|uniref:alpha/beta hydrolase n=1 Tax=Halioxenophilus sp. WMMB6 TaxID=3073815 RepID=UPI00295EC7C9|nr:alpha/beta hydrolase [Halioxenophilus sp. WMMB6]
MVNFTEQEFELEHLTLTARVWGHGRRHKVLALHGWLDNCASFNWLAPALDAHVVALDMAGHGLSGHRNHMAPYNIWEDVVEIFAVADQLGWEEFTLLGHSRGAMVAMVAAGTWARRVTHLIMLDGIWPESTPDEYAPKQLSRSVRQTLSPSRKRATVYESWEKAIVARMNSAWPIVRTSSEALAERGLIAVDGGFIWRADPKLQLPSAVKLTKAQIHAFMHEVTARCLLILADEGITSKFEDLLQGVHHFPKIEVMNLPGSHHFHMEGQADGVAALANPFIELGPLVVE